MYINIYSSKLKGLGILYQNSIFDKKKQKTLLNQSSLFNSTAITAD